MICSRRLFRHPCAILSSRIAIAVILMSTTTFTARTQERKADLDSAKKKFAKLVQAEIDKKTFPGLSVAWVVDGKIVYEAGFGLADPEAGVAATPETIYRAGSVSKLFTAVAAMQLVEQGKLDLDAPVQNAVPEFSIVNPAYRSNEPITLRQFLCHRSGMVREAPVGGYFDPNEAKITETIASIADCALVNPPNTQTRYSNVGPTIVGRAVEIQSGLAFPDYQQRYILGPLGMKSSAWMMNDELRPRLAKGEMRVNNGDGTFRFETAPTFELGTIPAGNLYSTVGDLARFAMFAMNSNVGTTEFDEPILQAKSLKEMYSPQLIPGPDGFGLGFQLVTYRGHKTVRHSGAVYGFSTNWVVLPEEKIAVVLMANSDIVGGTTKRLTDDALDLLLEALRGEAIPEPPKAIELSESTLKEFEGEYESLGYWADLTVKDGKLQGNFSTQQIELTPVEPLKFVANSRVMNRVPFEFLRDEKGEIVGFTASGQRFHRVDPAKVKKAPANWEKLVGSYGPSFIPLVISIRHGHLYASVENEYDYRLTPLNRVTFQLPPGMYTDEQAVFQLDAEGRPIGVVFAGMYLPRREN